MRGFSVWKMPSLDINLNMSEYLFNVITRIRHCFINFFFCCCISRNDVSDEEIIPCLGRAPKLDSSTQTDFLPRKKIVCEPNVVQDLNVNHKSVSKSKSDSIQTKEFSYRPEFVSNLNSTISSDLKSQSVFFDTDEDIYEPKIVPYSNTSFASELKPKAVSFSIVEGIYEPKTVHDTKARSSFDASAKTAAFLSLERFPEGKIVQDPADEIASDSDSFYTAEPIYSSKFSYDSDIGSYDDSSTDTIKSESYHTIEVTSNPDDTESLSLRNLKYSLGSSVKNIDNENVNFISASHSQHIPEIFSKVLHDPRKGRTTNDNYGVENPFEKRNSALDQRGLSTSGSISSNSKVNIEMKNKNDVEKRNITPEVVPSVPWPDDFRDFEEIDLDEEV